jgi:hypothetical protein
LVIEPPSPYWRADTWTLWQGRYRLKPTLQGCVLSDFSAEKPPNLMTGEWDGFRHRLLLM